jgi:hypothetical protein
VPDVFKRDEKYSKIKVLERFDCTCCLEANVKLLPFLTSQRVNLKPLDIPGIDLCGLIRDTPYYEEHDTCSP